MRSLEPHVVCDRLVGVGGLAILHVRYCWVLKKQHLDKINETRMLKYIYKNIRKYCVRNVYFLWKDGR